MTVRVFKNKSSLVLDMLKNIVFSLFLFDLLTNRRDGEKENGEIGTWDDKAAVCSM